MHVPWSSVAPRGKYEDSVPSPEILITRGEINTKRILYQSFLFLYCFSPSPPWSCLSIGVGWRPSGRHWQPPGGRPDWPWPRWRTRPGPSGSWRRSACTDCGSGGQRGGRERERESRARWHSIHPATSSSYHSHCEAGKRYREPDIAAILPTVCYLLIASRWVHQPGRSWLRRVRTERSEKTNKA